MTKGRGSPMSHRESLLFGRGAFREKSAVAASEQGSSQESSLVTGNGEIPLSFRLFFSMPIIGIFGLWLHPLYTISVSQDTRELLAVLAITASLLIVCGLAQIRGWLIILAQSATVASAWFYLCAKTEGALWLNRYIVGIKGDVLRILSGRISELTTESRLLILLIGWGMLVATVQHLALYRGSASLFSSVTLIYLLVLNRVVDMHTLNYLMLSAGFIIWLHGMCGLLWLRERNLGKNSIPYLRMGSAALVAAAVVAAISWSGDRLFHVQSGDPVSVLPLVSRLHSWAVGGAAVQEAGISGGVGTTGYGLEGGELGAPLSSSQRPFFTAESRIPFYWRGESMAYYDGRRWNKGKEEYNPLNLSNLPEGNAPLSGNLEERIQLQRVRFIAPTAGGLPLFSGGRILDVKAVPLDDGGRLGFVFANESRDSFRLPDIAGSLKITGYTVETLLPENDPEVLRSSDGPDPEGIIESYVDLPPTLTPRVSKLSGEIMASTLTRYDAAVAVRDYLQSRFPYTLDTQVPPPGADFVDDFLFEAKRGYCVHFATAMVILLRTADIPARYVQGYGPGTLKEGYTPKRYLVTQADAHAWVEVYFPGVGWVPFDPTPGSAAASALPDGLAADASPPANSAPAALGAGAIPARLRQGGAPTAPLYAAALLLPAAAWRWRRSLALLLAGASSSAAKPEQLLDAAALAWRGLAARYGPPPPGMTGREYASSLPIEDARLRAAVWQFVRQWETLAYSPSELVYNTSPTVCFAPGPAAAHYNTKYSTKQPHTAPPAAHHVPRSPAFPESNSTREFIRICLDITFRVT